METDLYVQRPTVVEVNLDHIGHNLRAVKLHTPQKKVMAIVKANAYGHGLVPVANHLVSLGVDQLGVAFLEEGIVLRKAGITLPILVLGGIFSSQIEYFFDYNLEFAVSSMEKLRQVEAVAQSKEKTAVVHLKFDTGLERIGVHVEGAGPFIEAALKSIHCRIKGVFSHLACSDDPQSPMTGEQLEKFHEITNHFHRLGHPMPIRHLANSGGVLHFPETHLDMIRPGLILYGVYPSQAAKRVLNVKPALSLISRVVYFKVVQPGQTISYGATWKAHHMIRVVTTPLGYGDGYPRALSNRGQVLIRGKRYPIVGNICMDQFMVNIEWETAYNGDEVVLIGSRGNETILVEDLAEWAHTIPYEILTCLNERIPRVYRPK